MTLCNDIEGSSTDASEDSVEVAVRPRLAGLPKKNKRKLVEPKRVRGGAADHSEDSDTDLYEAKQRPAATASPVSLKAACLAPKKRFKFDAMLDLDREQQKEKEVKEEEGRDSVTPPSDSDRLSGGPDYGGLTLLPISAQLYASLPERVRQECRTFANLSIVPEDSSPVQEEPLALVKRPARPEEEEPQAKSPQAKRPGNLFHIDSLLDTGRPVSSPPRASLPFALGSPPAQRPRNDSGHSSSSDERPGSKQRNYKNMTRERRVEANARERQRVHTITAAFDNLQAAIPTEDEAQKLSKLSVIKVATAYIMALSRMAGYDYTEDQSAPPVGEVISHCSRVIDEETRIKKRSNCAAAKS